MKSIMRTRRGRESIPTYWSKSKAAKSAFYITKRNKSSKKGSWRQLEKIKIPQFLGSGKYKSLEERHATKSDTFYLN